MADEYSRAISFMNSYFALVDGLASGLENHLAEDVVLDWFGQIVRGRRNVSTFIRRNKVDSRHMFTSIKPSDDIDYKENRSNRKLDLSNSKGSCNEEEETSMIKDNYKNSNTNLEEDEMDSKEVLEEEEEHDMTFVLNEGDLCNLFRLHITKTDIEKIEESINRMKLKEEMAPMIEIVKREHEQEKEDKPGVGQMSRDIKYVEAVGRIRFSRKSWKKDIYNRYSTVSLKNQSWHHPCKLRIAYSILKERRASISSTDNFHRFQSSSERKSFPERQQKLPSLEEITSLSNRLVPNDNDFGGYLKTFDFYGDRKFFLESLRNELPEKEGTTFLTGYVHNKLAFNRPTTNLAYDDSNNNKNTKEFVNFIFNYQIHVIIYESEYESRDNPHREYEKHV